MRQLPTGTVTFLFTDIEGSTRLWEQHPDAMQTAVAAHDDVLRGSMGDNAGFVVKMTGDGIHAVFTCAGDAVAAAVEAQRVFTNTAFEGLGQLPVRMGLHSGRR
ncbi:MAG: adenylate/guanylate cyclase domain-containing protein [Acidimicrobiia bacterium]